MIDAEARVRATFEAVAAATALHPEYVEPPRRRRRLVPVLLATATAVAAGVAAFALGVAHDPAEEVPPASEPDGRVLAEGMVDGRRWMVLAVGDGCVALAIEGRSPTGPRCALERQDAPPDSVWFERLQTTPEGDEVVLVAAVSANVEKVMVAADDKPATEAKVVADAAHPGARYVVTVLDRAHDTRRLTISALRGDGTVLESNVQDVQPEP